MSPPSTHGSTIAVLGAGSWGTALAMLVARNGNRVKLWDFYTDHLATLARDKENRRYLPGIPLPEGIEFEADLKALAQLIA